MKKLILIILLSAFGTTAFCQDITLKSGTEATYQLSEGADKKFTLTFIDSKTIGEGVDIESNLIKEKVDTNQVKIVLFTMESDGKKHTSFMIKTGMTRVLKYSAKIKPVGRRKFFTTDVEPVQGTISSNEMWSYEITDIILSDFEEGSY
jgi:hypothetical protein